MGAVVAPRSDLRGALVFIAIGAVIVFGSWRMDRMTSQGADTYTAPGLWPGVIGFLIAVLGGILAWRSVARARAMGWNAEAPDDSLLAPTSRFVLAAAMFFAYGVLLVGHGLPFWFATAVFVSAYVLVFRRMGRQTGESAGTLRGDLILALVCGAATAAIVTVIFEQLFFVRLP